MNGGRGAKGSINDRLISIMYRNRYKKFQLKKEAYTLAAKKREREYLKSVQNYNIEDGTFGLDDEDKLAVEEALKGVQIIDSSNIDGISNLTKVQSDISQITYGSNDSVRQLHNLSNKIIQTDIHPVAFDFENYDYYQIIDERSKTSFLSEDELIDGDKELTKVDDEITIVEELETFIDDSKELISEIKSDIETLRNDIKEQYTLEQMDEIQIRYDKIKEKVDKLKRQYDAISQKYDFEDFHLLENLVMMSAIDEYRDLATLDEAETLVDYCKSEIEQIDGIVIEQEKIASADEEAKEKKRLIKRREKDFNNNKIGVIYLDDLEKKIAYEASEQRKIVLDIEKQLANFKTEVKEVTNVVFHTEKLFGSFLRIAAGILTAPFSGRNIFGTYLGVQMINKGVRDLRASLEPEYVNRTEIVHSYTSVEREILNSMDHVKDTARVIEDSIEQLDKFDEEFKEKFKEYSSVVPEYNHLERQIEELKRKLSLKKEEVKVMKHDLNRQYEVNKVKVKKAS